MFDACPCIMYSNCCSITLFLVRGAAMNLSLQSPQHEAPHSTRNPFTLLHSWMIPVCNKNTHRYMYTVYTKIQRYISLNFNVFNVVTTSMSYIRTCKGIHAHTHTYIYTYIFTYLIILACYYIYIYIHMCVCVSYAHCSLLLHYQVLVLGVLEVLVPRRLRK